MSVYAENLLRELVALGHDVTLVSQYRDDEAGTRVYGGGPPPAERVPAGVRVVARPSRGETVVPADFEGDVADLPTVLVVGGLSRLASAAPVDAVSLTQRDQAVAVERAVEVPAEAGQADSSPTPAVVLVFAGIVLMAALPPIHRVHVYHRSYHRSDWP